MDLPDEKGSIDQTDAMKLINEEYQVKGIRVRAKAYLILQALGLLSAFYLAYDPFDFVFDETRWLLIFIASIAYLLFFMLLTLRIATNKELKIQAAKTQLILILLLDLVPVFILIAVALMDIS